MSPQRRFLHTYSTLLVYGLALVLVLAASFGCSAAGYQRFKAHGAAAVTSGIGGAGAVAVGGPAGLAVFGAGVLVAMIVDQTLEPEPEVHVRTVSFVAQVPPPNPDGTPGKPRVDTYVDSDPNPTPGNLKLPDGWRDLPNPLTWGERLWIAAQFVWWGFVVVFLLSYHRTQKLIFAGVRWAWGAAWRAVKKIPIPRKSNANRTP